MADIRIKKKGKGKNNGIIYWIIGFIIVAILVVWGVTEFSSDVERETALTDIPDQEIIVQESTNATAEYVDFVEEIHSRDLIDYTVTSKGLLKLSDALVELGGSEVAGEARAIEDNARAILQTDNYQLHSQMLGEAFISAAKALEVIQQNKIPGAEKEIKEVQEVVESFDRDRIIMEQKVQIKSFFDETAQVVEEAGTPIVNPS